MSVDQIMTKTSCGARVQNRTPVNMLTCKVHMSTDDVKTATFCNFLELAQRRYYILLFLGTLAQISVSGLTTEMMSPSDY